MKLRNLKYLGVLLIFLMAAAWFCSGACLTRVHCCSGETTCHMDLPYSESVAAAAADTPIELPSAIIAATDIIELTEKTFNTPILIEGPPDCSLLVKDLHPINGPPLA